MVKVERTFPAPASLEMESKKKNGSYEKKDVIEQLKQIRGENGYAEKKKK